MSVQQADGKREHRQTRVLLLKIGEGHELFKEESSVKIGSLSLQSFDRHKSYLCVHLIRKYAFVSIMKILTFCSMGLSRLDTSERISSEEAVAQTVCSLDSCKCIDRVCDICGVTGLTDHIFEGLDEDDSMSYYQWYKVEGVVKKHLVDCTIIIIIAEAKGGSAGSA